MTKKEYTEQEIITIAIEKGLSNGEELQNKFFLEKGYINSGKEVEIFIEKLEQGFESVELKLNPKSNKGKGDRPFAGKKRVYIVGSEKEVITERKDGRENNGHQLTESDKDLMEAVWSVLSFREIEGYHTISKWAELMDLYKFKKSDFYEDILAEHYIHMEGQRWFDSATIVKEFVKDYNRKLEAILKKTFYRLEKEGKIKVSTQAMGFKDGKFIEVSDELYQEFYLTQKKLVEAEGFKYKDYVALSFMLRTTGKVTNKKFIEAEGKIKKQLIEKYGVEFVYLTYGVLVIKPSAQQEINNLINYSYQDYYLETTKRYRYEINKEHYAESTWFWRSFFYLSATILLDKVDQEHMDNFETDLVSFVERYTKAEASGFGSGKAEIKEGIEQDLNDREAKIAEDIEKQDEEIRKAWELYELEMENELGLDVAIHSQSQSEEEKYLI